MQAKSTIKRCLDGIELMSQDHVRQHCALPRVSYMRSIDAEHATRCSYTLHADTQCKMV